jgi:hypothetical protein
MSNDYKPENQRIGNLFGTNILPKEPSDEDGNTPLIEG